MFGRGSGRVCQWAVLRTEGLNHDVDAVQSVGKPGGVANCNLDGPERGMHGKLQITGFESAPRRGQRRVDVAAQGLACPRRRRIREDIPSELCDLDVVSRLRHIAGDVALRLEGGWSAMTSEARREGRTDPGAHYTRGSRMARTSLSAPTDLRRIVAG